MPQQARQILLAGLSVYLSAFALTHPDEDHIQVFQALLEQVTIDEF